MTWTAKKSQTIKGSNLLAFAFFSLLSFGLASGAWSRTTSSYTLSDFASGERLLIGSFNRVYYTVTVVGPSSKPNTLTVVMDGQKTQIPIYLEEPGQSIGKVVPQFAEFIPGDIAINEKGVLSQIQEMFSSGMARVQLTNNPGIDGPVYWSLNQVGKQCRNCLVSPNGSAKICSHQTVKIGKGAMESLQINGSSIDSSHLLNIHSVYTNGKVLTFNQGRQMSQIVTTDTLSGGFSCSKNNPCSCSSI